MEVDAVPRAAVAGWTGMLSGRVVRSATDARLVALVREGNRDAFERIYDRYHGPILSFCRHMLGDPDEAADAVQHTFLAAYSAISSSEKPILLRAWLFTIARNRCYSVLRARREQPAAELAKQPSTEGLASQVQRREDLRQLLADVRRLPDDQRAALVLAELGTLNHREIGSTLGVPPAKVKALVFQARESLIASRAARDTDCTDIRRQLSTLRGGALRRTNLRRHLRDCEACRDYRAQVKLQRRGLAAILPVAPPLALKEVVLGAASGAGTAATAVAGGGLLAFKGLAMKGVLGAVFALVGTAGTFAVIHVWHSHRAVLAPASVAPASLAPVTGPVAPASVDADRATRSRPASHHARRRIVERRRFRHAAIRRAAVRSTSVPASQLRYIVPVAPSKSGSAVRHRHHSGARRHVPHTPKPAPPAAPPSPPPPPSAAGGTQATSGAQQGSGAQSGQGGGTGQGKGGGKGPGKGGGKGPGQGGGDGSGQGAGGPGNGGGDNDGGGGGGPLGGQGGPQSQQGNPQGQQGNPQGQQGD